MPRADLDSCQSLHYEDACFGEAWITSETVLFVHGAAESDKAWSAWVSHLARHYRVLRPDMRGFGQSPRGSEALPWIQAPTRVVTTEGSARASVKVVREWQEQIPPSARLVLPGDSYHVATAEPGISAAHVLEFIRHLVETLPHCVGSSGDTA